MVVSLIQIAICLTDMQSDKTTQVETEKAEKQN